MNSQSQPSTRRTSSSNLIRHFYSAVKVIKRQRQAADERRISRYMLRHHGIKTADCITELKSCIRDGLLLHCERKFGNKGSKKSGVKDKRLKKGSKKSDVKEKRFAVPSKLQRDGHDWYCFECHKGGEVRCCSSCSRVFHTNCVKDFVSGDFVCYICKGQEEQIPITKEKLNRLLGYLYRSMKDLVPAKLKSWKKLNIDSFIMKALLYNPVDLQTIQEKIYNFQYSHWLEFVADVKTFLHNVVIYYGEKSGFTPQTNKLVEYCLHDITEIHKCADCYEASNARADKLWFCQPCKPLHKLALAKVETFPLWPAKIITQLDDKYDVRFFGSRHPRSVIPKDHVKQIPPSIEFIRSLPKYGNTQSWEKAVIELIRHVICIGPEVRLERLPAFYDVKSMLQVASPNSQIKGKRKMCDDDGPRRKTSRLQKERKGKKTQNVYKTCDILVRKIIRGGKVHPVDDIVDKNIFSSEANSVQPIIAEEIRNFQSSINTIVQQTEMQEEENDVAEKTDSIYLASRSEVDSDTVSISELHEEINIKDEYMEEYQVDLNESGNISETNVTPDEINSEQVEGSSNSQILLDSTGQQEFDEISSPKLLLNCTQQQEVEDSSSHQMLTDSSGQQEEVEVSFIHQIPNNFSSQRQVKKCSSHQLLNSTGQKNTDMNSSQWVCYQRPNQVERSSNHQIRFNSPGQQTKVLGTPNKSKPIAFAYQSEMLSDSILLPKFASGITIRRILPVSKTDESKQQLSNANQIIDSVQKSQMIQNHDNGAKHCCKLKKEEKLEILAESVIVKEEPPCLLCSDLDMIPRKEAEKLKEEAVAETTMHYLAIIAQLKEECTKKEIGDL